MSLHGLHCPFDLSSQEKRRQEILLNKTKKQEEILHRVENIKRLRESAQRVRGQGLAGMLWRDLYCGSVITHGVGLWNGEQEAKEILQSKRQAVQELEDQKQKDLEIRQMKVGCCGGKL